jgi:hypothetical protein
LPVAQLVSLVQLSGQVAFEPLHTYGLQLGSPVLPLASTLHVPLVLAPLATEQASQEPPQAVSQQKPSTQLPL